jgi:hypothetical protein
MSAANSLWRRMELKYAFFCTVGGQAQDTHPTRKEAFLKELRATDQHHRMHFEFYAGGRDETEVATDGRIQ